MLSFLSVLAYIMGVVFALLIVGIGALAAFFWLGFLFLERIISRL